MAGNVNGRCRFNKMVDCDSRTCNYCGWNPEVAEIRLREWYMKRMAEREA